MKPPFTRNGTTGFTNEHGERVCTGSMMSRPTSIPNPWTPTAEKLHLQRVRLNSGGYDSGGAYWGRNEPLYCAFGDNLEIYVRASDRNAAKDAVARELRLRQIGNPSFLR